eukprot:22150-Pleurochrysis_carterae.AAC.2
MNQPLFEKALTAALKRAYNQVKTNPVDTKTFIITLSVGMYEGDIHIAHSICILLKFRKRTVRMGVFDPNGIPSSFWWVTDEDDVIQTPLMSFCKQHKLKYNYVPNSGTQLRGIQYVLKGDYCRLYNYFSIYMYMSSDTIKEPFATFIDPYDKKVPLRDIIVSYKPITYRGNNGKKVNMVTNDLLQRTHRAESPMREGTSGIVFCLYKTILYLAQANRRMWPDFPYLKKDGTSKVNIAVAVLLFVADFIVVCASMRVTHAIRTKKNLYLRKRNAKLQPTEKERAWIRTARTATGLLSMGLRSHDLVQPHPGHRRDSDPATYPESGP